MTEIDLILLGLIKDCPQSAYELQKNIEYRNISYWVKVSNPSIYKNIKQLENKGYIQGEYTKNGNMPEKKIFKITELGEIHFKQAMLNISEKQINIFLNLNAVIMNLGKVEEDIGQQCMMNIYNEITRLKEHIQTKEQERQHIPLTGQQIIKQQVRLVEVLEEWMKECIEENKKIGGI